MCVRLSCLLEVDVEQMARDREAIGPDSPRRRIPNDIAPLAGGWLAVAESHYHLRRSPQSNPSPHPTLHAPRPPFDVHLLAPSAIMVSSERPLETTHPIGLCREERNG